MENVVPNDSPELNNKSSIETPIEYKEVPRSESLVKFSLPQATDSNAKDTSPSKEEPKQEEIKPQSEPLKEDFQRSETKRVSIAISNDSAIESEGDDKIDIDNNEYSMNVLNTVVINTVADRLITYVEASTNIEVDFFEFNGDSKMTQTELTLIGKKKNKKSTGSIIIIYAFLIVFWL